MGTLVKVRKTQFKHLNGAFISLILINEEVDLFSASYLLSRLNNGIAIKTIEREAKALKKVYEFLIKNQVDLMSRLAGLQPLIAGEIESLSDYLAINYETGDLLNTQTFKHYFTTAQKFIEYWFNFYLSRVTEAPKLQAGRIALETMNSGFLVNKNIPHNGRVNERVGLTPELQVLFFAVIEPSPDNRLNPIKSEKLRWRNYILFLTMILTGNRKGESLGLLTHDLHLAGNEQSDKYIEILKRDRTFDGYRRKEIPSVKTKGRIIRLSNNVAELFEHYITEIRIRFKASGKTNYLFISNRDGLPLHPATPNKIIEKIIDEHPQFRGKLSPHILRNTFHDLLNASLDEKLEGIGALRKQQIKASLQEYAGGWAAGSSMVAHYPKGSIQARVGELTQKIQMKILSEAGDGELER